MEGDKIVFETQRLQAREMTAADYPALSAIVQDPEVMASYSGVLSDEETVGWLHKEMRRYEKYGFGMWAIVLKSSGKMIGQCGLTMQPFQGRKVLELGYLFQKAYWGNGYAVEAAQGAKKYAFEVVGADEVFSLIRDSNIRSMNVAIRNGMLIRGRDVIPHHGVEMTYFGFSARKKTG